MYQLCIENSLKESQNRKKYSKTEMKQTIEIENQLRKWADMYETKAFIESDPIRFPHTFHDKRDQEISAILSAYLAFGKRELIVRKLHLLHQILGDSPYEYVMKGEYDYFHQQTGKFYRFISHRDMILFFETLQKYYKTFPDLESAVYNSCKESPMRGLQMLFGHITYMPAPESQSACKRLNMFLRWVCRYSCVDLGIWTSFPPSCVLIPLDTHVHKLSLKLGITQRKSADMTTAMEINNYFEKIFPGDPGRGDFALFGYAINNPDYQKE